MTSLPWMRRAAPAPLTGDTVSRVRSTTIKASGDSDSRNVNSKQSTQRSRSKNKLPKKIRYDLENALVGLCDVWFEEIKPHLIRNNIKVHIEEGGANSACGDHSRSPLGTAGCSHLHPEYSAPMCELCRLLFNAANGIESAVSQAASAAAVVASTVATVTPADASLALETNQL